MLRNYLKTAIRNLSRHRLFTALALATVSAQAVKAATANPVKSLKAE